MAEQHHESAPTDWGEEVKQIGRHTLILVLTLLSIWIVHHALDLLLGKDAKFFDLIPIRYVIDTGDLAAFMKFIYHVVRSFRSHA